MALPPRRPKVPTQWRGLRPHKALPGTSATADCGATVGNAWHPLPLWTSARPTISFQRCAAQCRCHALRSPGATCAQALHRLPAASDRPAHSNHVAGEASTPRSGNRREAASCGTGSPNPAGEATARPLRGLPPRTLATHHRVPPPRLAPHAEDANGRKRAGDFRRKRWTSRASAHRGRVADRAPLQPDRHPLRNRAAANFRKTEKPHTRCGQRGRWESGGATLEPSPLRGKCPHVGTPPRRCEPISTTHAPCRAPQAIGMEGTTLRSLLWQVSPCNDCGPRIRGPWGIGGDPHLLDSRRLGPEPPPESKPPPSQYAPSCRNEGSLPPSTMEAIHQAGHAHVPRGNGATAPTAKSQQLPGDPCAQHLAVGPTTGCPPLQGVVSMHRRWRT